MCPHLEVCLLGRTFGQSGKGRILALLAVIHSLCKSSSLGGQNTLAPCTVENTNLPRAAIACSLSIRSRWDLRRYNTHFGFLDHTLSRCRRWHKLAGSQQYTGRYSVFAYTPIRHLGQLLTSRRLLPALTSCVDFVLLFSFIPFYLFGVRCFFRMKNMQATINGAPPSPIKAAKTMTRRPGETRPSDFARWFLNVSAILWSRRFVRATH